MWLTLSSDVFTGQIIASIIVLTFVAVFLLREWISQNARPGVFEDEELPDGDQVPAPPRRVEARVNELPEQLAQRQVEAIQALEALRAAEIQNGIDRDGRRILPHWQFAVNEENPPNDEFEAPRRIPQQKRVRRIKRPLTGGDGEDPVGERGLVVESEIERLRRKAFNRRLQAARVYGARRKAQVGGTLPLVERELDRRDLARDPIPPFEFTFRAPGDEELHRPASASETMQSTSALNHEAIEALFPPAQGSSLSSAAPPLPFSLSAVSLPPPPSYSPPSYPGLPLDDDETIDATPQLPRRPPLPTVTLPSVDFSTQPLPTSPNGGRAATSPLVSPSLATYCAPEEFGSEAGPSSLASYFTGPKQGALGLNTSEGANADSTAAQDGSSSSSWGTSLSSGATPTVPMGDTEATTTSADDSEEEDLDDVPEDLAMDRMTPSQLRAARDKYFTLARAGRNPGSSVASDGGQLDSDDLTSSGGEEELRIPTPPPPREHVFGGVLVIGADDTDEDGEEDEQSEDDDEEDPDINGELAPALARVRVVQPAADGGVDVVFNPQVEPVRLPQEGAHLFEIGQAPAEIAQLVENELPDGEVGNQADEPGIPDAAAAALLAGNEDLDGNGEDDMEGALEGGLPHLDL